MKIVMLASIAILLVFVMTITSTSATSAAPPVNEASIYFTTYRQGLMAVSLETNKVHNIVNSTEILNGITYDSVNKNLYWSTDYQIFQSDRDGGHVETVLDTNEYGSILGLAIDWIVGNIYVTTNTGGQILACGGGATGNLSCFTVLDDQRFAYGIALDPTEGLMYWTRLSAGSLGGVINRAGMDGSSPRTLFAGLNDPRGVTIDFASRRLLLVEGYGGDSILSMNFDGRDVQYVVQLPQASYPWGIGLLNDRVYWTNEGSDILQSSTKDGRDIQTLYTGTRSIYHLAVVPALDQQTTRANDCAERNCSTLCVLTPASYRCLN